MEGIPLLRDILILMAVSVPISIILTRIGLPTIVGFFVTGVIIGPSGFGLVTDLHTVEVMAEIGIVLLLFTIGLEFSVKRMIKIRREVVLGGGLQIALTTFFVWIFATFFGLSLQVAILLGFIVSLSSSAIVLKLLVDRVEVHSSHGNLSVGILLFQDISMVLMVLLVQGFGEATGTGTGADTLLIFKKLGIAVAAMAVIVVTVAYIVPKVFHEVVKLRNREVFMLTIVLVCLGTAWVTSLFGISLALGAFIAGLVISESEYSNQIVAEVLPFRDTFSSLFFISIGMLLEINYIMEHFVQVLSLTAIIIFAKAAIVVGVGQILRYPLRLSIIVGLNLAQIGEFSFILIKMGEGYAFLTHDLYQSILVVSVLTMAVTPFLFQYSPAIAGIIGRRFGARFVMNTSMPRTTLSEHVIVVGYGLNGRNLAKVLKETAIEHLVMEVNYNRVKEARKDGHTAHFGDSSHPEILKRMGIEHAKLIVIGISDVLCTRRTVKAARDLNSGVTIVVRTRYISEVEELYELGANQVIPEEFETSVEVFSRVLKEYNIPGNIIQNQIDLIRQEGYAMFRSTSLSSDRLASLSSILQTSVMDTYFVEEGCKIDGMTLLDLDIRRKTGGATIMAVVRDGKGITNPRGDFEVKTGDMLVVLGSHGELHTAMELLKEKCPELGDAISSDKESEAEAEHEERRIRDRRKS